MNTGMQTGFRFAEKFDIREGHGGSETPALLRLKWSSLQGG